MSLLRMKHVRYYMHKEIQTAQFKKQIKIKLLLIISRFLLLKNSQKRKGKGKMHYKLNWVKYPEDQWS